MGQVVIGVGLKKLMKFKTWLTVPDAARHLSILFGEDVTEADVLRFALDVEPQEVVLGETESADRRL
jgi:hypothetical protein